MKLRLEEFKNSHCNDYINLYEEFIKYNSDLIPDILEIKCRDEIEYNNLLKEIANRENGKHSDIDCYFDGHYYLLYDNTDLVGIGCIRNNLTSKGYEIWGNIAYGIRPTKRKCGYRNTNC